MYAAHGWQVVHCRKRLQSNGKKPGPVAKGWQNKGTINEYEIAQTWAPPDRYNVGILTGQKSGIVVVDIDIDADPDAVDDLGLPSDTRWVRTPTGGRHCYLKPPPDTELRNTQTSDVLGMGIDFRGDDGFVYAPPSSFPGYAEGRRYRRMPGPSWRIADMPEQVLWLLTEGRSAKAQEVSAVVDDVTLPTYSSEGKERHAMLLRHARRLARYRVPEEELTIAVMAINIACCVPPKTEDEVRRIVKWAVGAQVASTPDPVITYMKDVKETKQEWLWHGRFPLGAFVIVDGDPDKGKSTIIYDLIARMSCGGAFPDNSLVGSPKKVLIMSSEDNLKNRIAPILRVAGANLGNIVTHELPRDEHGYVVPFTIPDNLRELETTIRSFRPDFIMIDPIMGFMGEKIHTGIDASIRRVTGPLADIAERYNACMAGVRHLKKDTREKSPLYRGGGSIAILGQARVGLMVGPSPLHDDDSGVRVLAVSKNNLMKFGSVDTLGYEIVGSDEDETIPCVRWVGTVDCSAEDILEGKDGRKQAPERDECLEFIDVYLSEEHAGVSVPVFNSAVRAAGFSRGTQARAWKESGHHKWREYSGGKIRGWRVHHRGLRVKACGTCSDMPYVEKT
jgi:hypothetical protein